MGNVGALEGTTLPLYVRTKSAHTQMRSAFFLIMDALKGFEVRAKALEDFRRSDLPSSSEAN